MDRHGTNAVKVHSNYIGRLFQIYIYISTPQLPTTDINFQSIEFEFNSDSTFILNFELYGDIRLNNLVK